MIHLLRVLEAASEIQKFCELKNWKFCFIGGVAIQRWGQPRLTHDVDLTLLTGFGKEEKFAEALLSAFVPRREDALEFALSRRVLLITTKTGVDVDIAMGAFPFEERSIARASSWDWSVKTNITTCSAEDLIVHKAFAGRDIDWADVEWVLTRQHAKINLSQIRAELKPLLELKGETESLMRLEQKIALVDRRLSSKP